MYTLGWNLPPLCIGLYFGTETYHSQHSHHSHHPIPPDCLRITRIARLASHRIAVSRKSLPAESHGLLANGGIS